MEATALGVPATGWRPFTDPRRAAVQAKTLEIGTQALLVTLLPRLLGPAEFGRLGVAMAIVTLTASTISLGAPSAFARFIPAEPLERRAGLARNMTLRLLPIRGVQLVVAAAVGAILVVMAPSSFAAADTSLVFAALTAEVAALLAAQVMLGIGQTWIWSFRMSARNVALLLGVPLLYRVAGPAGILYGLVLASIAGLVFAAWPVVGLVRHADRGVAIPDGTMRYGVVTGLAALVGQATYRGPVLAASVLAGSGLETGFAALAGSVAMAVMLAVREGLRGLAAGARRGLGT